MQSYEVEIKSLLGSADRAEALRSALKALDPKCTLVAQNRQLNHYFEGGNLKKLVEYFSPDFPEDTKKKFIDIANRAKTYSVRTRDKDGKIILVIKASVDETTSENGISRMELENTMNSSGITSIDDLDRQIIATGFTYQAKWSREREEYLCKGINVCIDKNAGYGYVAEFELVVDDASKVEAARKEVAALMTALGVRELPQERLERMFAHYNASWQEYYGTDRIFVVE